MNQRITAHILNQIVEQQLGPGSRLPPERTIAESLGVSRTAVRDAIKTLSGLGVLEARRAQGTFITGASPLGSSELLRRVTTALLAGSEAIHELFEIRKLLEAQTAAWAARRATTSQRAALRNLFRELQEARTDIEPARAYRHDALVHRLLTEAAQNKVLEIMMGNIWEMLGFARVRSLSIPGRAAQSYVDHLRIIAAVLAGDEDRARAAMFVHLQGVEETLEGSELKPANTDGEFQELNNAISEWD